MPRQYAHAGAVHHLALVGRVVDRIRSHFPDREPASRTDAQAYAQAFDAADGGDFIGAQMQAAEIQDKSLLGYLSFRQLMHPTAHKASFDELASWLAKFRDLPLAERIFSLAVKRKPAEAAGLDIPSSFEEGMSVIPTPHPSLPPAAVSCASQKSKSSAKNAGTGTASL